MSVPEDLMPMAAVAQRLQCSRMTLLKRVKDLGLTVYVNPLNGRERLLSWSELVEKGKPRRLDANHGSTNVTESPTVADRPSGSEESS